ncbi:MAG: transcription elongation factor GreA [Clostridiales bacterium]|nr:transcription elongation factor GreA [Clostridiales bacterium]
MANEAKFKMSRQRFDEIREELHYLETVREKEVSELIKEARSFGDLSENSEYDEAKTEQGKLYSKIAELKNVIENAEIIETIENTNNISLGSKVTVECLEDGEKEEYQIVGSQEANPLHGRVSDDSPIGQGLLGHTAGDTVTIEAPAGEISYRIISIE